MDLRCKPVLPLLLSPLLLLLLVLAGYGLRRKRCARSRFIPAAETGTENCGAMDWLGDDEAVPLPEFMVFVVWPAWQRLTRASPEAMIMEYFIFQSQLVRDKRPQKR